MARILLVDDDADFTAATRTLLQAEEHDVETVGTLAEAAGVLDRETFDMLFVDLALPDGSGLELIQDEGPKAVIITGHPSMESAIRAVRGRVVDYLVKPLDKAQLIRSIESVTAAEPPEYRRASFEAVQPANMIGESPVMKSLFKSIAEYGPTDVTILITGESGTGKDLVAQALHNTWNADAQFVPVNCGAIPRELVASELFGHEKGSFTGAAAKRVGVFERAKRGTVFLDEIGELPLEQQVNLLRIMETRSMLRVGGEKEIPMMARIVAATNKDLEKEVSDGKFREDLFFRLMVLPIHVPPLRERDGDVTLLANYYLQQYAKEHGTPAEFSPNVLAKLDRYHWPGNVRELKHTVLRAAILNRGRERVDTLPENFDHPPRWSDDTNSLRAGMSIREVEKTLIEKTLEHFDGNKKLTAEALGISLKTLYNRLCEYEEENTV
ncbi:MAG TPA: sigma-54 dependent transcriptional regulator [Woeseiaceae bacterium]|nr:sigma-54 dependent transcriptional regulator [Woeseiaceae bacterium]